MEKNIYEIFGLSPIDDPMSLKSLSKIKSTFTDACLLSDSSEFLELLKATNILFDPEKKKLYDDKILEIQKQKREEMLKQKIEEITLKKIEKKLPSGCFIEDIYCDLLNYSKPRVSITISKPTGKWVVLCRDIADTYGDSAIDNYSSPGAPYFNSKGFWGCNSYGVEESDKNMPEYIKDIFDCPILLTIPKKTCFIENRELHTLSNTSKIEQLEKKGIFLIDGISSRWSEPVKRMIVSSLKVNYVFPSSELTDKDIAKFESSLDQIEVVNNLRRVEISIVSEDDSIINNHAKQCIEYFQKYYALDYHVRYSKHDSKKIYTMQMGIPVNKFEEFREEIAIFNINIVDYKEISEDQSLSDNKKVSVPIRKKRNN